jgi:hypothetical protein
LSFLIFLLNVVNVLLSHFGRVKTAAFQTAASAFLFLYLQQLRCLWQYVVSTAFIRDFLIGEADIASFSCYSKPPVSAGGAFTIGGVLLILGLSIFLVGADIGMIPFGQKVGSVLTR